MCQSPPIRDAAAVIALRRSAAGPRVLMGQRGAGAAVMPGMVVFPGGVTEDFDAALPFARPLSRRCRALLERDAAPGVAPALAGAAIREFQEETGLMIARPGQWTGPVPAAWDAFAQAGLLPDAGALDCISRAITPRDRAHRFDARFFLVEAETAIHGDLDDLRAPTNELTNLSWMPLEEARAQDLPFVTAVALAELAAILHRDRAATVIPFFDQPPSGPVFRGLSA